MKLELLDKSNYFKALLILVGIDKKISAAEKQIIRIVGEYLGFEDKFIEEAMANYLDNEYIIKEPPEFSDLRIAKCLVRDGIKLAFVDGHLSNSELDWLKLIAKKNTLSEDWLNKELDSNQGRYNILKADEHLEINDIFEM
ncbi:hypothetical protein ACFLTH_08190 [Bacteroidota bacterium]